MDTCSKTNTVDETDIHGMPINLLYVRYLMSSFLYYNDYPVLPYSDIQFDWVCKRLLDEWDSIEHMHKHLCSREALEAGTGFDIKFTNMIKYSAIDWVESFNKTR